MKNVKYNGRFGAGTLICATVCAMVLAGVLMPTNANAQKRAFDFTPHVGFMAPLSNVVDDGAIGANSVAAEHNLDFLLGGRLTYWLSDAWGIELGGMYAPNGIENEAFGGTGTTDATFYTLSGRLVYDFGQTMAKPAFLLTGGLGFFATDYDAPLDMITGGMGLVGLGLRFPFSEAISLRVDLVDYMTTTNWTLSAGGETDKILQHDITLKGGLTFSFGDSAGR